jgi:hypothetical protein
MIGIIRYSGPEIKRVLKISPGLGGGGLPTLKLYLSN